MPQWIAMVAIVVVGWLALAVLGGFVVGRGLSALERHQAAGRGAGEGETGRTEDVRRAA